MTHYCITWRKDLNFLETFWSAHAWAEVRHLVVLGHSLMEISNECSWESSSPILETNVPRPNRDSRPMWGKGPSFSLRLYSSSPSLPACLCYFPQYQRVQQETSAGFYKKQPPQLIALIFVVPIKKTVILSSVIYLFYWNPSIYNCCPYSRNLRKYQGL